LGCLFFMGIFMKRVTGAAALAGLVANYAVCIGLDQMPWPGKPHMLLYGFFGMVACVAVACGVSVVWPGDERRAGFVVEYGAQKEK